MLQYFVGIACLIAGAQCSTFYACSYFIGPSVDCDQFSINETCGTDRLTYKNKCHFSQAHCKDTSLDLLHYGACSKSDIPTTPPDPIRGQAILIAVFCTRLSHIPCDDNYEPVCGKDAITYRNPCEFEKAKCMHRNLHMEKFGDCDA